MNANNRHSSSIFPAKSSEATSDEPDGPAVAPNAREAVGNKNCGDFVNTQMDRNKGEKVCHAVRDRCNSRLVV
jgi:hypothetical protein